MATVPPASLHTWLQKYTQRTIATPVTLFVLPSTYTFYTAHHIIKKAFMVHRISYIPVSIREYTVEEIKQKLATAFLGMQLLYWLYDLENVPKQVVTALFKYLASYTGPHTVIMVTCTQLVATSEWPGLVVSFPSEMTKENLQKSCSAWFNTDPINAQIDRFFKGYKQISFDLFSAVFPYIPLLGTTASTHFEQKYVARIVSTETPSLFSFMDFFWQKKPHLFYQQWQEIKQLYNDQFWISFWSEQLFRAHAYAHCMHTGEASVAQQIAARKLSFFYTKTGWKTVNQPLLKKLHHDIYMLDYTSKNGGSVELIERIYLQWFAPSA